MTQEGDTGNGDLARQRPKGDEEEASPSGGVRWARLVLAAFVLALFVFLGRRYFGELRRLAEVTPGPVAAMIALLIAARLVVGKTFQLLLAKLGHRVGLGEMFLLNILTSYTNLLLPRVGLSAPAIYLKYKHGVSYAECSSLLLPIVALHVIGIGLLGLACQSVLRWTSGGPVNLHVAVLFALVIAGGLASLFVRVPIPDRWQGRIAQFIRRLMASWRHLGSGRSLIASVLGLRVVLLVLRVCRLYVAFRAIGAEVSFVGVFIATLLGDLALLVSITPAGLGFREAAIAYSAAMLGCSPAVALSAAVLDRLVMTVCVIVIAQFGVWKLTRPMGGQ